MPFPITAALPIVGSLLGGSLDRAQSQRNQMFQQGMSDMEFARNVQFWHMQNEYNSPKAQMQRFADAGLNPHLIYGQGTPGNAQGLVRYQRPDVQAPMVANPQLGPAIGNTLSVLMEVGLWSQDMERKELENNLLRATTPYRVDLTGYQRDVARQNVYKSQADVASRMAEFQHLYGTPLKTDAPFDYVPGRGYRAMQQEKLAADTRLRSLQGEYYEPALIYKAVLGGALGLAGLAAKGRSLSRARRPTTHRRQIRTSPTGRRGGSVRNEYQTWSYE